MKDKKKLDQLERVIRNISHEVNNPLTAVKGYADLLFQKAGRTDDFMIRSEKIIKSNVQRIEDIFSILYDIFALVPSSSETVKLNEIASEVVSESEFKSQITVDSRSSISVKSDAVIIEKIFKALTDSIQWSNFPGSALTLILSESDGIKRVSFIYSNVDFISLDQDNFYLPYMSKGIFKTSTELYLCYYACGLLGWDFVFDSEKKGFHLIINEL